MTFTFTIAELNLLIEALSRAASRHESEARFNPKNARPHDDKAAAMRKLRHRLLRKESANA
jgi:hypothetical protein